MNSVPKIYLLLGHLSFHRDVILGAEEFARDHGGWNLHLEQEQYLENRLGRDSIAGIVAHAASVKMIETLQALSIPVVNISRRREAPGLPTVVTDNEALGRQAAAYFLNKGFRSFVYLHQDEGLFSDERERGFAQELSAAGFGMFSLHRDSIRLNRKNAASGRKLEEWLSWFENQAKPVALFAASDGLAAAFNDFCFTNGIRVPYDVAILGCNNDEVACLLKHPPRSSVDLGARQLGRRAAEVLYGLMQGGPPPGGIIRVPPGEIVSRQSTDVLAVSDPVLQKVMLHLRDHLDGVHQVEDLCSVAGVSRRPLEIRFQKYFHRTPLEMIHETRLQRARMLLSGTILPMGEIAQRCGYRNAEVFSRTFRKMTGMTPSQYRRGG
jgi:LacI family transcriptional regulator